MSLDQSILQKLQIAPITPEQLEKIHLDLQFIDLLTKFAKQKNMRVVVHGGYAVDGFFGKITRPHGDIDLVIWGSNDDADQMIEDLLEKIKSQDSKFADLAIKEKSKNEYTRLYKFIQNDFLAEIYYARVASDPFSEVKELIKTDGNHMDPEPYDDQLVTLEGITFAARPPLHSIVDRIFKQNRGDGIKSHHTQDIKNLKLVTNENEVELAAKNYRGG